MRQQLQIESWMDNAKQNSSKVTKKKKKKVLLIQPIDMPLPAGLWEGGIRKNGRVALTDSTSSNSNTDAKRATRKKDESGGN
jgi:hypothetical protein